MLIFIDLIAQSYLKYVIDGDKEITPFFSQEFNKVRNGTNIDDIYLKATFFEKLCSEIDSLIIDTHANIPFEKTNKDLTQSLILISELSKKVSFLKLPNDIKKEDFDNADELLFEIYRDEIEQKDSNHVNWQDCNDVQKLFSQIYLKKITLEDPIVIIHPSKTISKNPLVLRKSNLEFLKTEADRAKNIDKSKQLDEITDQALTNSGNNSDLPEKRTVNSIISHFNSSEKQGWKFAFTIEQDFNDFVNLLALNLEQKPVISQGNIFKLKKRTKTRISAILRIIHDELSDVNPLKHDTQYFEIIRTLSEFRNMNDLSIYNSLTK